MAEAQPITLNVALLKIGAWILLLGGVRVVRGPSLPARRRLASSDAKHGRRMGQH